jgi:DTW domain-containing protein YfiP
MNQREQYRSSNTAKVIERVLGGEIYIDGIDEDWQRFQALTDKYKGRCFVLFPSEESVEYTQLDRIDVSDSLIVVVDGTWRQARKLNKKIDPSIPRVRITPTTLSKFLCRRQTRVDRVCTAEALSLLLEDMGKREASENLDTGFSVVVEGFNMQCYNKSHRPSNLLKHPPHLLKPGSNLPPRHPDALIKDI